MTSEVNDKNPLSSAPIGQLMVKYAPSEDRRLKYVRLTEKGKEICATSEENAKEGDRILLIQSGKQDLLLINKTDM